jgi:hypothetical protein
VLVEECDPEEEVYAGDPGLDLEIVNPKENREIFGSWESHSAQSLEKK